MTLLHTILSARLLRNRIPAATPRAHGWPMDTVHTREDVLVGGHSLRGLATTRGTPAVLIHPAGHPERTGGSDAYVTLVITRVLAVAGDTRGALHVRVDGDMTEVTPDWAGSTVLGRPDAGSRAPASIETIGAAPLPGEVPQEIQAGDLLVVPCAGTIALATVRHHPATTPNERNSMETWTRCAK